MISVDVPQDVWDQPMRDGITLLQRLSLAGHKPRIIPEVFTQPYWKFIRLHHYIDGLVEERYKSIANALELRLSCTNPIDNFRYSSLICKNI